MNKRLFFLKNDGWVEEDISDKLTHATHEELVLWAYSMMERKNYRNYLVSENPERVLKKKVSFQMTGWYWILDAGYYPARIQYPVSSI